MYKAPFSSGVAIMPTNADVIEEARQAIINNAGGIADLPDIADHTIAGDVTSVAVSFLADQKQLEAMLPPGKNLSIYGPPIVTVAAVYQGSLNWLAGRGYNLMLVMLPVVYNGRKGKTIGSFLPVVWENMTEPIMMGRETLGWPKIYADMPMVRKLNDTWQVIAAWDGFPFVEINVKDIRALTPAELEERAKNEQPNAGLICHKYIVRTGSLLENKTDADYLTISTNVGAKLPVYKEVLTGKADLRFMKATWQQLPTMVHIVNRLAALEIREVYDATMASYTGGSMGVTEILE
jgi:hypothetical protein